MSGSRIGVFGGTFDPIHLGHLIIASECAFALRLDQVLFIPSHRPPHKPDDALSAAEHRFAMIQRAIAGHPGFSASAIELDRPGVSFTVDTLRQMRREAPSDDLWFIMGADSLRDLHLWRDPAGIVDIAELVAVRRPGITIDLVALDQRVAGAGSRVRIIESPLVGVSSSDIRRRVAACEPISYHVPLSVEQYIHARRLYRGD